MISTGRLRGRLGGVVMAVCLLLPTVVVAATTLTVSDARQRALEFNRGYLSAGEEIDKARDEVIKARAGALPEISASGSYSRNFILPSFFVQMDDEIVEFKTGFRNNFGAAVSIRQSLWQGGKVLTALAIAREYERYAQAEAASVAASVVYNVDVLFFSAVLARSRLAALQQEYAAAQQNAEVVELRYSQGDVSRYELLRATVEKLNLEPALLQAESEVRLAEKRLKSFIGVDLNDSIVLVDEADDTSLAALPSLAVLIDTALVLRPEMQAADLLADITRKAVRIAKGDFLPSIAAVSTYSWQSVSDDFTLRGNKTESWTAGVTVSIPIFAGGRRVGQLRQRQSEHYQARLNAAQLRDDIRLEVEAAYDRLIQAKQSLDRQKETIALAQEGLRIANLRYETGVGTLLEVLSAQAALTDARNMEARALFSFRTAKSALRKATAMEIK